MTLSAEAVAKALKARWEHICDTEAISGRLSLAWYQLADAAILALDAFARERERAVWEEAAKIADEYANGSHVFKGLATRLRKRGPIKEASEPEHRIDWENVCRERARAIWEEAASMAEADRGQFEDTTSDRTGASPSLKTRQRLAKKFRARLSAEPEPRG